MINRVTHVTVQRSTLANLQVNLASMGKLQQQLSSGKMISKPSDDPGGTAQTMQLRAEKRAAEQFQRNADDGVAWLGLIDSALTTSVTALRRARDLTVQGANSGAMGQTSRDAIATEIRGIRDNLVSQANTSYLGRSVFAGTSNAGEAFAVTPATGGTPADFTWTGSTSGTVERRISPDATVRVDVDGRAAFGEGPDSVFAILDRIAADLESGVNVGTRLNEIDVAMERMLTELADVGTRYGQLTTAQQSTQKTHMDLTSQISGVEDIDLAEVLVQMQSQEVAYKAALGATSRVLQPSLLDFLR